MIVGSTQKKVLKYKNVGDVRGSGFFQGIDIVKSKKSRQPFSELAVRIRHAAREEGVLVSVDGVAKNVIKFKNA